jgi:hypothetical protein
MHMPSCPSGEFCVSEPAKIAGDAGPAPYAKCAAVAKHPDDLTDSGFPAPYRSVRFSPENTKTARAKTPNACCYTWVTPCPGGRAFRDLTGTPSVARTIDRADWAAAIGELAIAELSPEVRAALADHWTREAAFEHASIASFAQLTLDLLAAGAPPDLLTLTQRAAMDEIEHARISFALASAYRGQPVGPAALAAAAGSARTIAAIARTTLIDACAGETVASALLFERSRDATDPILRDLLHTMGDDEERHAELAWKIVAWALRSGDPEVERELASAKDAIADELVALGPSADPETELRATVLREVVLPCLVALLAAHENAARSARAEGRRSPTGDATA